ncbi:MAG: family N-acetyltransferase [Aeromicrobium sp.]|nr:family N-acetyltransferase [Aeromicrobium sp.]
MTEKYLTTPIDTTSQKLLAADGLRFELVDNTDRAVLGPWSQVITRSFLEPAQTDDKVDQLHAYYRAMRLSGVWDDSAAIAEMPVATFRTWPADLTVPGQTSVPAWAISSVAVTGTHRRRGIARAMMEAELRTASALGIPVAMLTVSESTIYGNFGFGPAALGRDLIVNTRRAGWIGPEVTGRVQFVTQQQLLADGHPIVERVRLETPGQIEYSGIFWDRLLGVLDDDKDARALRFARYDDADGTPQGFAIFTHTESDTDFIEHKLTVNYLVTATDDAYAGIWRFLLETDLVSTVTAALRPLDEPLRLMVADYRAIRTSDVDHLWIRILDVKQTLEARTYSSPGRMVIAVSDPLGYADGSWALEVGADGTAVVTPSEDAADATMSVNELGSIYLGGVSAVALARAGRIVGDATQLDAMFASAVAPWCSIWF